MFWLRAACVKAAARPSTDRCFPCRRLAPAPAVHALNAVTPLFCTCSPHLLLLCVPPMLSLHCSAPYLHTCSPHLLLLCVPPALSPHCCACPHCCRPTAVLWQGTILPGVTRRSIIELARSRGYTVEEEPVSVTEAMEADEVRIAACARCDGCVMPRV